MSSKDQRREEAERKREERDRLIEEEEERVEQEKLRKEQEEFNSWKALMSVEETGISVQDESAQDSEIDQKFLSFILRRKVVMLEDLACEFKMVTKEVVAKIEHLEESG